jgi:D-sedoheptulose 7-phosphate isomerase
MPTNDAHLQRLGERYPVLAPVVPDVAAAGDLIGDALGAGGTLFVCGNGGSAADSEHIAGELLKGFLLPRPLAPAEARAVRAAAASPEDGNYLVARLQRGLRAVALTGHTALATAVANDTGADLVFAQPLWALARPGDVLLAISTSGNARNVCLAAQAARARGLRVVALTGATGGRLRALADVAVCVPASAPAEAQELHLPVYHALCAQLEARFFAEPPPGAVES